MDILLSISHLLLISRDFNSIHCEYDPALNISEKEELLFVAMKAGP